MNFCMCGTQAGYPHEADCPFPLFRGSEADRQRWTDQRDRLREAARILDGTGLAVREGEERGRWTE